MAFALLITILFAVCGVCISTLLFSRQRLILRIWLGLVVGLLLLTWLPSLFAFFIGFSLLANLLALFTAIVLGMLSLAFSIHQNGPNRLSYGFLKRDLGFLWIVVPLFILGYALFSTHILKPLESGAVAVGQVTYGDLAMHLGFISSIAAQGTFPPEYSIFPGHTVNYPFLCETSASSLVIFGANLRQAYLISALYAYLLVLIGVWFFFRAWLKTNRRAHIASLLFFLGSGFGFAYFFDLAKHGASLNQLLDGNYFSNFSWLLDGFYDTPTNLPTIGLRWVNPIVDMLIPQRATLFGWAFLFPCLYLLHGFTFDQRRENILPLGLIAGLLPLIHTHSFLGLGIISGVYCLNDLIWHFDKKRLFSWLTYAGLACLLGMPQLFGFAFRQASESSMMRLHWNWANEADSFLWFYVKNWGWLFLLLPIALFTLSKRDRRVYLASVVLWVIAEIMVFQPNNYDNNKLLFIWFAYTCGLVGKLLDAGYLRLSHHINLRSTKSERVYVLLCCTLVLDALIFISLAIRLPDDGAIAWYTICTLLLLGGLCVFMTVLAAILVTGKAKVFLTVSACCTVYPLAELLFGLWRGYAQTTLYLDRIMLFIALPLLIVGMILMLLTLILQDRPERFSAAGSHAALHLAAYLLTLTLTLSSTMTILRELKSEYQVYSPNDLAVTEYIRDNTAPDSLFLANSYLWNLVTPTTGRSIVTGTSTFLFFHGIINTERENDVRTMYEQPANHTDLFSKYGINYVLISNAERYNYDIDMDWFIENGSLVFENNAAQIYRMS